MKKLMIGFLFANIFYNVYSQNVGIGTTSPNTSALLDVSSTTKGALMPRMNTLERQGIISPTKGLLVFDTNTSSYWYYGDGVWKEFGTGSSNSDSSMIYGKKDGSYPSYIIGTNSYTNDSAGIVYDSGGPNGNYANNENLNISIASNGELKTIVEVMFMQCENPYDSLTITTSDYTSNNNVITRVFKYFGTQIVPKIEVASSLSNAMWININFISNGVNTNAGFAIRWTKIYANTTPTLPKPSTGFHYIPNKLAVRGGIDPNSNWSNDSVGVFSFSYGNNNKAKGINAVSLGGFTEANGDYSVAAGLSNSATGRASTSVGHDNIASGEYSLAGGNQSTASGKYSIAIGWGAEAIGDESVAFGRGATAGDVATFASGRFCKAALFGSTALGFSNSASGYISTALGRYTTASGEISTAMGNSTTAYGENSTAMGNFTKAKSSNSLVIGTFNDTTYINSLFEVGNGISNSNRSNAFLVDAEGGVKIKYSGSSVVSVAGGTSFVNLTIPPLPIGWNFTNTMILVSNVDGQTGTIYQAKLTSLTNIQIYFTSNSVTSNAARFNYIIFKL